MKIGYLGPNGSFSSTVVKKSFPKEEQVAFSSIPACIKGVEYGEVDLGVVPIENTIEGSVNTTVDYLFHQADLTVIGELILPIQQQLMVHPNHVHGWQASEKVLSHPQALAQCQSFLAAQLSSALVEAVPSTTYGAKYIKEHPDQKLAAIAPTGAAEKYGLKIVASDIQDVALNQTRFWVISKGKQTFLKEQQPTKLSLALTLPNNLPGSLHKALATFGWREINLSKIESRPLKTSLGEYFFLIDILLDKPLQLIEHALAEIELLGGETKIFGIYPVTILDSGEKLDKNL